MRGSDTDCTRRNFPGDLMSCWLRGVRRSSCTGASGIATRGAIGARCRPATSNSGVGNSSAMSNETGRPSMHCRRSAGGRESSGNAVFANRLPMRRQIWWKAGFVPPTHPSRAKSFDQRAGPMVSGHSHGCWRSLHILGLVEMRPRICNEFRVTYPGSENFQTQDM